jgi:hypothetical protein
MNVGNTSKRVLTLERTLSKQVIYAGAVCVTGLYLFKHCSGIFMCYNFAQQRGRTCAEGLRSRQVVGSSIHQLSDEFHRK